jgi:hypothetical protein
LFAGAIEHKIKLSAQHKIRGCFIVLGAFVGLGHVHAANVTLNWQSSSSTNVAGYNIYYGTASGQYTGKIMLGNVDTATISNLDCGTTYYFSATALDSNGNESGFSNETRFLVPGVLKLSAEAMPGNPLMRPPAPANPSPLSAGTKPSVPLVIKFPVVPSHWYEVQATVDFKSWTTIWQTGVATSNAWVECLDPDTSAYASRFYRLVLH